MATILVIIVIIMFYLQLRDKTVRPDSMQSNDNGEGIQTSRLYPSLRQPWIDYTPAHENEEEQEVATVSSSM